LRAARRFIARRSSSLRPPQTPEALLDHRAAAADGLGFLDLQQRGTGVADGEEELGVFLAANGVVTPVHGCYLSLVLLQVLVNVNAFTNPPTSEGPTARVPGVVLGFEEGFR
jgi:hypothetical protein